MLSSHVKEVRCAVSTYINEIYKPSCVGLSTVESGQNHDLRAWKSHAKKNMQSLADDKSQSYVYMISCRGGRIKRVYLSRRISKNLKTFLLFILWIIELRFFSTKWVVLCKYSFVVFRQKSLVSLWPIVHDFIVWFLHHLS